MLTLTPGVDFDLDFVNARIRDGTEATHILLGRPWQFDRKVFHDGFTNKISFNFHRHKVILKSLSPKEVHEDQVKMREKR